MHWVCQMIYLFTNHRNHGRDSTEYILFQNRVPQQSIDSAPNGWRTKSRFVEICLYKNLNCDCYPRGQRRPTYIYTTGPWLCPPSKSSQNIPLGISFMIMSDALNCEQGGGTHSYTGLRVASIFIVLVGSGMGALFPVLARRSSWLRVPNCLFKSDFVLIILFS